MTVTRRRKRWMGQQRQTPKPKRLKRKPEKPEPESLGSLDLSALSSACRQTRARQVLSYQYLGASRVLPAPPEPLSPHVGMAATTNALDQDLSAEMDRVVQRQGQSTAYGTSYGGAPSYGANSSQQGFQQPSFQPVMSGSIGNRATSALVGSQARRAFKS